MKQIIVLFAMICLGVLIATTIMDSGNANSVISKSESLLQNSATQLDELNSPTYP